jgi:hypothetical protein
MAPSTRGSSGVLSGMPRVDSPASCRRAQAGLVRLALQTGDDSAAVTYARVSYESSRNERS